MAEMILVSLCVNDDFGAPSGHVERADFNTTDDYVSTLLELESQWWYDEEEDDECPHPTFEERVGEIVVQGISFPVVGRREHVGNIYWNGYRMTVADARHLAIDLCALGWQVMCWTEGNPLLPWNPFTNPIPQLATAHPVADEGHRPGAT